MTEDSCLGMWCHLAAHGRFLYSAKAYHMIRLEIKRWSKGWASRRAVCKRSINDACDGQDLFPFVHRMYSYIGPLYFQADLPCVPQQAGQR